MGPCLRAFILSHEPSPVEDHVPSDCLTERAPRALAFISEHKPDDFRYAEMRLVDGEPPRFIGGPWLRPEASAPIEIRAGGVRWDSRSVSLANRQESAARIALTSTAGGLHLAHLPANAPGFLWGRQELEIYAPDN